MKTSKKVIVLASGGVDSTACIHFYKNLSFEVSGLFIDYAQPASLYEKKSLNEVAKYYRINYEIIKVNSYKKFSKGNIVGRNAFLLFAALTLYPLDAGIIAIGIHKGTSYFDCGDEFLLNMQNLFANYSNGEISIGAPFINLSKLDIFHYCNKNRIPINLTYSCEQGTKKPCGSCLSCKDKENYIENSI